MDIDTLFIEAHKCKLCYGDAPIHVPFPDPKNGKKTVLIMFIKERPGRIGTGKSGFVSFDNNDPSAHHFKDCFFHLKISREKVFITNACICHPETNDYKDTPPKVKEIKNLLVG